MKLSKRGEYALRALIDLGIAAQAGRDMLQLKEIATHERIPYRFLEQIFLQLREAGYVATKRGKHGGYFLKSDPHTIAMGQVVRMIDGPLAPIGCVSQTAYEKCSCPDEEHCGLRMLMLDVRNAIAAILDRYSLGQVIEVTIRKLRRDKIPLPFSPESRQKESGKSALATMGLADYEI
jgi:Rrf2 family protein